MYCRSMIFEYVIGTLLEVVLEICEGDLEEFCAGGWQVAGGIAGMFLRDFPWLLGCKKP